MVDPRRGLGAAGGFTLIELLIVITILSLILVALTSGVRFAGRAWETQERRIDEQGDLNAVQNVLSQLIASGQSFEGDGISLRFVAAMPRALARGGLYDVELRTAADRLVLAWRPHFNGPARATEPTETELFKGVFDFEITYLLAQGTGPAIWLPALKDKAKPPVLVRIALQTAAGRRWPPLVVAPMIEAPTSVQ